MKIRGDQFGRSLGLAILTFVLVLPPVVLAADVDIFDTPIYHNGFRLQGGTVFIKGMALTGNVIDFAGGGVASGNSPSINFNQGGSQIQDIGDMHIRTDDFLFLDAPNRIFVQNDLQVGHDLQVGRILSIINSSVNQNTGSGIYDDGNLHIVTASQLQLDASVKVGSNLSVTGALTGAGLTSCSTAATDKLLWNATTGKFSCAADVTGGGAGSFTTLTATGDVTMNDADPDNILIGAAADTVTIISNSLSLTDNNWSISSTGAANFSTLSGAGLSDCDTATTSKLLWDVTTSLFSCGTDQTSGGTGNFTNLTATGTVDFADGAPSTLLIGQNGGTPDTLTIAGDISVTDSNWNITSAGAANFSTIGATNPGTATFTTLNGTGNINFNDGAPSTLLIGQNGPTPDTLTLAGDVSIDDINWSVSTAGAAQLPSIGSITPGTGVFTTLTTTSLTTLGNNTANVVIDGANFDVAASGATTLSGHLTLSSDASEGISGGGLTDCDAGATDKLLWDSTTNKFSCGTDQISGSGSGSFTDLTATGNVTMNDASADSLLIGAAADTVTIVSDSLSLTDNNWSIGTGGTANFVSIGGAQPGTGSFTTLTSTGVTTLGDNTNTVAFNGTNFDVATSGLVTLTNTLVLSGDAGEGISGGGLTDCDDSINSKLLWDTTTSKFSCGTDQIATGGGPGTFSDLTATGNITFNDAGADTLLFGAAADTVTIVSDTLSLTDNNWSIFANGAANFVSIGGAQPGTGVFTDLTATGAVDFADASADSILLGQNGGTPDIVTVAGDVSITDTNWNVSTAGSANFPTIGGTTPGTATFTTLTATGNVNFNDGAASTLLIGQNGPTPDTVTLAGDVSITDAQWSISAAGAANLPSIGATTPGTGSFTSLTTTGLTTLGNNSAAVVIDGTNFDVAASGAMALTGSLTLSSDAGEGISGGGLTDCDTAATSKLLWDVTTNQFSCGTDQSGGGGAGSFTTLTATGDVTMNDASADTILIGAAADTVTITSDTLSLTDNNWNISATGAANFATLSGAGLTDCDTAATSKLLWDVTTSQFSCGVDQTAGGAGTFTDLTATGNVTMNDAGADTILIGAAADTVTLTSDTLSLTDNNWNISAAGAGNFVSIGVITPGTGAFTTLSSTGVTTLGNNTATVAIDGTNFDLTAAGAMTLTGHLTLSGDAGEGISGGGLTDCDDGAVSKLLWDITTSKFSCGTDQTAGGSGSFTTLTATGDVTFNDAGADTILIGAATDTVTIVSDTLSLTDNNWSVSAAGAANFATLSGAGLTDCDTAATSKLLWDVTTSQFSCGVDQTTGGSGTFTDLTATGNVTFNDAGADNILIGAAADTVTITSDTLSLTDNNWNVTAAGAANFASIGGVTPGTGAFTTLSSTGVTTLGNNSATVAIDSSDWDISTTGVMTGIGAITADGTLTVSAGGASITGGLNNNTGGITNAGAISGGTTGVFSTSLTSPILQSADNNSTLTTNIPVTGTDATLHTLALQIDGNTGLSIAATGDGAGGVGARTIQLGVSAGADSIAIGDANADVSLTDANWSITGAGVANFASIGAGTPGTGTFTDLTATGNVTFNDASADTLLFGQNGGTPDTVTIAGDVSLSDTQWNITAAGAANFPSIGATTRGTGAFTNLDANGTITLPSNSITDAMVSDTLTASIFIGSGSTTNAVDLATAEVAGTLGDANITDTLTISGGTINGTTIGATTPSTGAFTTLSSTGVTTLGNNSATVAINSSDWDISTTGVMTGIGAITADGILTVTAGGASITGGINNNAGGITNAGAISGGTTGVFSTSLTGPILQSADNNATLTLNIPVTGTDATLHTLALQIDGNNALSIAATGDGAGGVGARTIQLGVSSGADTITIGDANADVSLTDANWSITGAGVANFASIGAGTPGTGVFTDLTATGNVTFNDASADTLLFGQNGGTPDTVTIAGNVSLTDTNWDISAAGAANFPSIGATTRGTGAFTTINANALITGTLGATITGATTSINASSNFATNINTGTSTGAVTIGNSAAGAVALVSGAAITLQGAAASSFATTAGNITFQAAGSGTTANIQIGVGGAGSTTPDLLVLDTKSTAGDPTGTNGAIYYNESTDQFRCFQNGAWRNCISLTSADAAEDTTNNTFSGANLCVASLPTTCSATELDLLDVTAPEITPDSTTDRILITGTVNILGQEDTNGNRFVIRLRRGTSGCAGTQVGTDVVIQTTDPNHSYSADFTLIDSPATTSPQGYTVCGFAQENGAGTTDPTARNIMLTIMEVAADGI